MVENKSFPKFASLDELVAFVDNNDLGDYLDSMPVVEFEVDIQQKTYVPLVVTFEPQLTSALFKIAKSKQTTPELLVNAWIKEKIGEYAFA
jgi:hypothetical protein